MSIYVLDTSALLAYIENEDGVADVERVLLETLDDQHKIYVSVVSFIEVFYISCQEQGQKVATERMQFLKDLPLIQEPLNEKFIEVVGALKASHTMSFADCCIAGLAKEKNAVLIHKDPEFEQVEKDFFQLKLPYKIRSAGK
ncbi:MAG: type II toxin-antitoxin system VapC family toxin [Candidatus Ozemobacteraceae bacterium]